MQVYSVAVLFISLFAPLISANACVAGGPADQVSIAQGCCRIAAGKWFQNYANQAICVMPAAKQATYTSCVSSSCTSTLDTVCIACDYATNCGLS